MIPVKHSTIFRSRWWALVWAGGIIWTAVDFVGSQPGAQGSDPADNGASAIAVANALG